MKAKGKIGLLAGLALALGNAIGGGTWVYPVVISAQAGPIMAATTLSLIVPVFMLLPAYIAMTTAWPVSPGHYYYLTRLLVPEHKRTSQIIGWLVTCAWAVILGIFVLQLMVAGGAAYLNALFPAIATDTYVTVLVLLTIGVVGLGLRIVGWLETVLVSALFISLAVIIGGGLLNINPANLTPSVTTSTIGVLAATALAFTTISNSLFIVDMSGEIRDSEKNLKKIFPISLAINIGVIAMIIFVATGTVPSSELTGKTLRYVTNLYLPGVLSLIPAMGALLAGVTTAMVAVIIVNRYVSAAAEDGILPQWLSNTNQFGEPIYTLTLTAIASVSTIYLNVPIGEIANSVSIALITILGLMAITGARLPRTHPEIFERDQFRSTWYLRPQVVQWSSLLATGFISLVLVATISLNPAGFRWYLITLAVGFVIYVFQWAINSDSLTDSLSEEATISGVVDGD